MEKIISLFKRDYEGNRQVFDEVVPGAEWVIAGEGVPTEKIDGTCCLIRDGKLYRRYDAKKGKTPPPNFEPAQEPDEKTGHWPGWIPVGDNPEDKYHREALDSLRANLVLFNSTYELIGPKVQGNPYGLTKHALEKHGSRILQIASRDFDGIKAYLESAGIEGIVWHHPDGRMVKIKAKDFGIPWPPKT